MSLRARLETGAVVELLWSSSPYAVALAARVSTGRARVGAAARYLDPPPGKRERYLSLVRESLQAWPSASEHVVLQYLIDGCSRVCSHQLVRHRIASYTQRSQRYSDRWILGEIGARDWREALALLEEPRPGLARRLFVLPPGAGEDEERLLLGQLRAYAERRAAGWPPWRARYLLPQALRTSILATLNLRELHHIARLRCSPAADWEIRGVACAMKSLAEEALGAGLPL